MPSLVYREDAGHHLLYVPDSDKGMVATRAQRGIRVQTRSTYWSIIHHETPGARWSAKIKIGNESLDVGFVPTHDSPELEDTVVKGPYTINYILVSHWGREPSEPEGYAPSMEFWATFYINSADHSLPLTITVDTPETRTMSGDRVPFSYVGFFGPRAGIADRVDRGGGWGRWVSKSWGIQPAEPAYTFSARAQWSFGQDMTIERVDL